MKRGSRSYSRPSREVKCQLCPWRERRFFGHGILVKPCPKCGNRMTFATAILGDIPMTPDPKLNQPSQKQAAA